MHKTVLALTVFLLFIASSLTAGENIALIQERSVKGEALMKVNFYKIDRQKITKGEYVGFAEIKDGKFNVEVTDPKLEKILRNPYATMSGERKGKLFVDKMVTYQPGTIEHLRSIAIECYRFGYIGETEKKEKQSSNSSPKK